MTIITCHGLDFSIEGQGFAHAEDDFRAIVDRIDSALDKMPSAEVARLHAAATFDPETGEPADADTAEELYRIGDREAAEVLKPWHNPNGAAVMLAAISR